MSAALDLANVSISFGGLRAVSDLNLRVEPGTMVGLIGPNGAGKTTVFNLITGVYAPTAGSIHFAGAKVSRRKPHEITRIGIARTFQNIRLFQSLSVYDNVRAATLPRLRRGISGALWRGVAFRREEDAIRAEVMDLLDIFGMRAEADLPGNCLPYGDQRRLEIVRALATRPKLLLLDEPAAGMNPMEKVELMRLIQFIKARFQISVLLVEHDMKVVMGICERVAVLEYGVKIAEGSPEEIQRDPNVIAAYLGTEGES